MNPISLDSQVPTVPDKTTPKATLKIAGVALAFFALLGASLAPFAYLYLSSMPLFYTGVALFAASLIGIIALALKKPHKPVQLPKVHTYGAQKLEPYKETLFKNAHFSESKIKTILFFEILTGMAEVYFEGDGIYYDFDYRKEPPGSVLILNVLIDDRNPDRNCEAARLKASAQQGKLREYFDVYKHHYDTITYEEYLDMQINGLPPRILKSIRNGY